MGLYDHVEVRISNCPACGELITNPEQWQTKDLQSYLANYKIGDEVGCEYGGKIIEAHNFCGHPSPQTENKNYGHWIEVYLEICDQGVYTGKIMDIGVSK